MKWDVFKLNTLGEDNINFKMYSGSEGETFGLPYDYKSVMHYHGYAWSKNGQMTMQTLDPKMQQVIIILSY